ncbi:MAG: hypothetical protein WD802_00525 [Gemmatimonadaceae bacterium]
MSKQKLRVHQTDTHHLISNLRGEVGEVITSWTLWRSLRAQANRLRTADLKADLANRDLIFLDVLSTKIEDELVARLSELAEQKIGQLTFHFAATKLQAFESEVRAFATAIRKNRLEEKRNQDISHKVLPESWNDHKHRHISYKAVLRCLALAVRLMKQIDRSVLGPAAPYLWRETRKKRYEPMSPPRTGYLLLPHMRLSEQARARIVLEELAEGKKQVLSEVRTLVNGQEATILAAKEWGGLLIGQRLVMLGEYPLQQLTSITTSNPPC